VSALDAVLVVVPARNEEERVRRCLESVTAAVRQATSTLVRRPPLVEVVLVADACTDSTAAVARTVAGVHVLEVDFANVGAARAAGVALALRKAAAAGPAPSPDQVDAAAARIWIASTDADSTVPPHWLLDQIRIANGPPGAGAATAATPTAGADVMVGTVQPDFADLTPDEIRSWCATHPPGRPNGHVHGANLGVRASHYLAVGGFQALEEHEDVDLVDRLVAHGARVLAADSCEVVTSGRLHGRTPGGYASYLRLARGEPVAQPAGGPRPQAPDGPAT
jgi:hypothetical protein